jgi:hypothetical protein
MEREREKGMGRVKLKIAVLDIIFLYIYKHALSAMTFDMQDCINVSKQRIFNAVLH